MSPKLNEEVQEIRDRLEERNPNESEFLQAADELLESVNDFVSENKDYLPVLERMLEPERIIIFRVPWVDDDGKQHTNRGFRVQFNSALGPYKGGLRFHPSVNLSILKFLGLEQIFKNAGVPNIMLGGGKGGSDFNPRDRSDNEVMRFCQSFMTELYRHIGAHCDVPAGDIGVGGREVGFMFGQYKRITGQFQGVLTGKGPAWGGSRIRSEATGYGAVYFLEAYLKSQDKELKGLKVAVSGSGNVAQYCVQKLLELGAVPVSMSDSGGVVYEEDGIDEDKLKWIMEQKNEKRGRLSDYPDKEKYHKDKKPWQMAKCDIAMPSATQNELDLDDAKALKENGCIGIMECANMPCTQDAVEFIRSENLLFGPAKSVNAGGVAVSGLEMSQDAAFVNWSRKEVDEKLKTIMQGIFDNALEESKKADKEGDLLLGANLVAFKMVADAMRSQGTV